MLRLGHHSWSEQFVVELARLLVAQERYGPDRFAKALRPLAEAEAPDLFFVQDKVEFARRSGLLYASFRSAQQQALRLYGCPSLSPPAWKADADRFPAHLQGSFLLSLNDRPEVRRIMARFTIATVQTSYTIGARNDGQGARYELLISSPAQP